jgi:TonB family protein
MANCATLINVMKLTKGLPFLAFAPLIFAQTSPPIAPGSLRPDGAYQAGNGVSPPSVMFRTTCEIPDLARKVRAQGEVTLSLVVKSDGSVRDLEVVRPVGYGIDERATECIRKWRFKPGAKDGSPVDVAFRFAYSFGLQPQPRMWGAGPLTFAPENGVTPPTLKSATMPNTEREPGDETVLFEFSVSSTGEVSNIQALEGTESKSLSQLTKSFSSWKFSPASSATGPAAATGRVLLIKGEDYFRYRVSKAFRDCGSVHPGETKPVDPPSAPRMIVTIKVPIRIDLDPVEASKQLIDRVPPEYPAEAKAAHVQGTVSLLVSIGKDGSVTGVKEISGPPELIRAAVAAVKQWRYQPIISRGEPQEASTVVDIPFKLPD